jgi:peptide/nickel transport system substrate-binding protein
MKRVISCCIFLLTGLICISLILSGCTSTSTTTSTPTKSSTVAATSTPKRGGIMKIAGPPDPGGPFGWPADIIGPAAATAGPCLETLYRQAANGSYYPWLATSYDLSTDKKTITFHLRKGVKFHDGTDFNAQAVKTNFDAIIEAKQQPFWVSTDVVDDYTLNLHLTDWSNLILGTFGDASYIASPTAFQKNGKDWADVHPIGTGPFVFDKYEPNTKTTYKRFDSYWVTGKPYLDGLEIDYIMDPLTLKAAMQSGDLDMINVSLGQQQVDMQNAGFVTSVNPMTTYVLVPDTANPDSPFAKLEVRQAVEYAIDREGLAKGLGYGTWTAPYQIPAPSNGAYDSKFTGGIKYDPVKAKELLAKAGYSDGFSTSIISQPAARQSDVEAAIQANLNAVGIKTELKDIDQGTFVNYQANGWQDAMLISPIAAFGNYNSTLQFYFSSTSTQFKSWQKTDEFLALFQASLLADTLDINLIRKVTNYMTDNSLVIPVSESGLGFAYASYVKDAGFNERGFPTNWNMESVWLDK